ncbi:MAG TPA: hypothetical protein VF432_02620 [Thermoanaerobaculia bacterium]
MTIPRTKAVLEVLRRGHEEKLAQKILRVFGATTIDEALATYEAVGAAERASIDETVARMTADASAAFQISVDNKAL